MDSTSVDGHVTSVPCRGYVPTPGLLLSGDGLSNSTGLACWHAGRGKPASYSSRNTSRREYRTANADDVKIARGNSPLPVILIANQKLNQDDCKSLGLVEIHASRQNAIQHDEIFYVYEQEHPPA